MYVVCADLLTHPGVSCAATEDDFSADAVCGDVIAGLSEDLTPNSLVLREGR